MTMHLIDDGTLDTVFECSECGTQERYSQEWRADFVLSADHVENVAETVGDFDVDAAEAEAEDDHECSAEEPPTEPEPGDYILAPAGPLGVNTAVSVVEGGYLGTFDRNGGRYDSSEDWALVAVREHMEQGNFYPNVWRQDDHGGFTLLTLGDD